MLDIKQVVRSNIGDRAEDIGVHISTDGHGYQGNAALLWQPVDMISVGASYRTSVKIDMEGTVHFALPDEAYASTFPDQDVQTCVFPTRSMPAWGFSRVMI